MVDETQLRRKWLPASEQALRDSFDAGMFEERNWCELKRQVNSGKEANLELARDLASMSVDGGTIIVGLDEKAPGGNPLHPVELNQLCERIESVAATRCQPPLQVEGTPIDSPGKPGLGYAMVHIPASPLAPHQVEGVYFGRGDKQKRRLPDAEIERLFARRASWGRDVMAELEAFGNQGASMLFTEPAIMVIAHPVVAWPEMFRGIVGANGWRENLAKIAADVAADDTVRQATGAMLGSKAAANHAKLRQSAKTPGGARIFYSTPRPAPNNGYQALTELSIDEEGVVRFLVDIVGKSARSMNAESQWAHYLHFHYDHAATIVLETIVCRHADAVSYGRLRIGLGLRRGI